MAVRTEDEVRRWAMQKLKAWNWNANVAEIARELINEDVRPEDGSFAILGREFVKFFGGSDEAKHHWEIIGQIVEEFG